MNYTENYHLPQWDEDDRILRVDFNSAMANLENGLTGSAGENRKNLDRFCRMAYNHYRMVQDMNPVPRQIGMFRQDPAKDAAGVTGMQLFNGIQSAWNCPGTLTEEMAVACFQELTPLQVVKGNLSESTPFTASFNPPVSGRIELFYMSGGYTNNIATTYPRYRAILINQDTGRVELSTEVSDTFDYAVATISSYVRRFSIAFLGGVHYLLKVEPVNAVCDMQLHFVPHPGSEMITYASQPSGDISWTIHEAEGGAGGMAILHCQTYGAGGTMTFLWDGVERQPYIVRTGTAASGQTCQELIFLRGDQIPINSTLSVHFECAEGGVVQFYDWGAILF